MAVCPSCATRVILPTGDKDSDILFISSHPDKDEARLNRQFAGQSWQILRREMMKFCQIDILEWRRCFLLFHEITKDENCTNVSLDLVKEELNNRKLIIISGVEAAYALGGYNISDVNGMVTRDDELDAYIFYLINPSTIFSRGMGELNFALTNLNELLKEIK